jgi:hypothetical protein
MTQTLYVNIQNGTIGAVEPLGVAIIEARLPEGADAEVVLPLLQQIVQQTTLRNMPQGYTPPAIAYKLVFGNA